MRSTPRWRATGIGLGAWLGAALVAAEPLELAWQAPAECPSHDEASAALMRLAAAGSELGQASVEIVRTEGRWQATLSTRGAQRRLEGESCGAVVEALTVVLALAADQAQLTPSAPQQAPPTTPSAVPSPASPATPAAGGPGPAPGVLRWALRVGILAEVGMLPGPSIGPRGALELHRGDWSLELGLGALLPRHAQLSGANSPASEIRWLGGQVAVCHALRLRFSACSGAEYGRLSGTGSGVDEPIDAGGWWLAGTVGARSGGPLYEPAALSWQLGLGAALALVRPEFGFDELGVLHRPSALSGRLFLGLGWQ
ncbi:MAG: hypothetical protein ABI895_41940 [Deltaproteobacteria bacterium]